ncbi:uncharacterized protein AC631_00820 [Debaryomyces fabryi]|uniref:Transcriptional protein SWT1 n=1 Tax=Debaryomyces fabryi TaxID=58627 RepID=A0A0V1Q4R7_9ASCO|nr:uncharacterized protein AC631_00820 [Debaryomyces fabryi]KSA03504.1 hypothetical protein AC631_00820 [Debaryomyces fabryi]CUM53593.1 unnamed protein product [Debaryomyces fabryi]
MSLPSKYAPEGLSSSDQKRTITVGHNRPRMPINYAIKTIEDRIDEAVKHSPFHNIEDKDKPYEDDIEMIPMDDYNEVEIISDFVKASRNNSKILYDDSMDIVSETETNALLNELGNVSYLVVDTNFILSHLNIVNGLQDVANNYGLQIIIPITVMKELDGLKNSSRIANEASSERISNQSVGHLARWANDWIYSALAKNSSVVRGQKLRQRLDKSTTKDDAILDCCLYFKENYQKSLVVLLSNDKNFCLKALSNDILTVSYRKDMNVDIIANTIYTENLRRFGKLESDPIALAQPSIQHETLRPKIVQHESDASFNQTSRIIFQEVQTLTLSVTHHCMENNYGEDLDLIRNYDRNAVTSLKHCSEVIIRFWLPVFSNYFKGSSLKPFTETEDGKKIIKQPVLVDIPIEPLQLNEFIEFWSRILSTLYLAEMNDQQNDALELLIKRWKHNASLIS